jgi:exopolyphosphatase / guanosine-5'-triphosphate,3'-diphosphate pyrophosphatase
VTRVFAAADIGSNTAHLLVAATDGELVTRVDNYNEWIGLGEIVARKGEVPRDNVEQLIGTMTEFRRMAKASRANGLYVFATEAIRKARNSEAVLKKVQSESGVRVEVIPPRREAELSLRGIGLDTRNLGPDVLFEVGGGSAQIGRIAKGGFVEEESLPLGTGRVIAESGLVYPTPDLARRAAETYIARTLERGTIVGDAGLAVACGGVARGLWRALHPDGEKTITREEIEYLVWATGRLSVDRIVSRFSVKSKRGATLLPGALVYRALMDRFGLSQIFVSEFGIREGAILEMAGGRPLGGPV